MGLVEFHSIYPGSILLKDKFSFELLSMGNLVLNDDVIIDDINNENVIARVFSILCGISY